MRKPKKRVSRSEWHVPDGTVKLIQHSFLGPLHLTKNDCLEHGYDVELVKNRTKIEETGIANTQESNEQRPSMDSQPITYTNAANLAITFSMVKNPSSAFSMVPELNRKLPKKAFVITGITSTIGN